MVIYQNATLEEDLAALNASDNFSITWGNCCICGKQINIHGKIPITREVLPHEVAYGFTLGQEVVGFFCILSEKPLFGHLNKPGK